VPDLRRSAHLMGNAPLVARVHMMGPGMVETRAMRRRRFACPVCPICYELAPSTRPYECSCDHLYHLRCLLAWAAVENTCPMCRAWFNVVLDGAGSYVRVPDNAQH